MHVKMDPATSTLVTLACVRVFTRLRWPNADGTCSHVYSSLSNAFQVFLFSSFQTFIINSKSWTQWHACSKRETWSRAAVGSDKDSFLQYSKERSISVVVRHIYSAKTMQSPNIMFKEYNVVYTQMHRWINK